MGSLLRWAGPVGCGPNLRWCGWWSYGNYTSAGSPDKMRVIWLTGVWGREEVPASLFVPVPDYGSMALGLGNWKTLQGFWRVLMAYEGPARAGPGGFGS